MYYRPRLSDGRLAPFAWQIRLFFLNVNWPLEDNTPWMRRLFDNFMIITCFMLIVLDNAAVIAYILLNIRETLEMMDAIGPVLILTEVHFRIYNMALRKEAFKKFLQEFYSKIFIERDCNVKIYRQIQRSILPTKLYSYSYFVSLFGYISIPVMGFFKKELLLPYNFVVPYDCTRVVFYIPTLLVCLWILMAIVSCIVGESNLLAAIILHLNGRYLLLKQDCENLHLSLVRSDLRKDRSVLFEFRQSLIHIIQRNVELNNFAAKLEDEFSFRVFVMMGMSSVLLCVLGFMMVTIGMSSKNISYITWFAAKTLELIAFGQLGSKLMSTTNEISSMYYMSNWEDVILQSSNSVENSQLMKLIALAIEMNQKPMYVMGLNYFNVSLATVLTIYQCAFSYFSFLYAIHKT